MTAESSNIQIQDAIRRVVAKLAAERSNGPAKPAAAETPPPATVNLQKSDPRPLVDAAEILATPRGSTLEISAAALVTPLAADAARERKISLVRRAAATGTLTIAVGADHGGFLLKESLKNWLSSLGHRIVDMGTSGETPCDYPDFALAVARAVQSGNATFGIMIDGAGIGSSMTANRVAGVLAALCNDPDAARNAREHNYANMLTLGAKKITENSAREIILAFLSTPEGEARHGRRVAKIRALDRAR